MLKEHTSQFAGEKILIADDEAVIVDLTALLLRGRGFEVLIAHNGKECLEQIKKEHPSLVLLDYMMPVMDGETALKEIVQYYPDTYVIMFTGKGSEEVAVRLMKAGAADYLQKPFVNSSLLERIDTVLLIRQIELNNRDLQREKETLQQEIEAWSLHLERRVEEKSKELDLAHREILLSEKLAALGHITAGMAHEIRNPLNAINLFAQILSGAYSADVENSSYIRKIIEEVERIDGILIKMLAASRGSMAPRSEVKFDLIARKVLSACEVLCRSQRVEVNFQIADNFPSIIADPNEIEQIFTNLVTNALFEMQEGGALGLHLSYSDDFIYLKISDTGRGIPDEHLSQIFDPFFTTKEKGTGFGLSVVLRIVRGYGGQIKAESEVGSGTTFIVKLPATPASTE
ncbi:hybrid sensor histidine kinase/response regulator [Geopsychrobacter electrodiphilus]|uniref:hybrid sensor histidine kinase/response regulator n=1 Tax=Geopsychrobacter electrodiphilus TaxID=225196 RepID=UPI00035D011B|nr:hybrid sensor histidine kinase/response regulator [Geopsychrobacter electrodiphilus]